MKEVQNNKKSYNVLEVIKRMLKHMAKQDKGQFGRIFLYTLLAGIYPFFAVLLPKIAIGILEQGGESAGKTLCISMAVYFLLAGSCIVLVSYLQGVINARNMRTRLLYLGDLGRKLMKMDYCHYEDAGFFQEYEKGVRACDNNNNGMEGVYNRMSFLPAKVFTVIGMVLMAGTLNPLLLIALVAHVLVIMWTSKLTHDYEYSKKKELSKAQRKIGYYERTTQDFSYGKDIRIFNLRKRIMDNYQQEINAYVTMYGKIRNREFLLGLLGIGTLLISNVLTYGILIVEVINGMPVSSFTMYVTMVTTLMTLLLEFGNDLAFIWNEGEYINDFYRLLDAPLIQEGEKGKEAVLREGKESIEIVFDHVTFRYPGTEKNVFTDLNFTIHEGERLAIVGVNGAGKSTLVKLMTGLFVPTEGHIYVNGVDITELKKSEIYDLYSAVFQDVNVLAFTLRENVGCASENVDDKKVQTALDKVGLWNKVEGFEKGLDQMMLKVIDEDGTDFSGGERQKLSIARGLYKDAPMVIMDEPTAALDALAEAEIYENFSGLVEGKTAVYISHRLASTRFCDKIALFDADGLAEYGTHDELMEKEGKYYEMFVIQGKYYQEEMAE